MRYEAMADGIVALLRYLGVERADVIGYSLGDGKLYFTSGARTRKSRNLSENPNCVVAVSLPGLDLVIEGRVDRVTDRSQLVKVREQLWLFGLKPDQIAAEDDE